MGSNENGNSGNDLARKVGAAKPPNDGNGNGSSGDNGNSNDKQDQGSNEGTDGNRNSTTLEVRERNALGNTAQGRDPSAATASKATRGHGADNSDILLSLQGGQQKINAMLPKDNGGAAHGQSLVRNKTSGENNISSDDTNNICRNAAQGGGGGDGNGSGNNNGSGSGDPQATTIGLLSGSQPSGPAFANRGPPALQGIMPSSAEYPGRVLMLGEK